MTRIFRWGTVLAPPSPFGIAVLAYSLSEPQVSPCKGPTSVSWPYPLPSPESLARPQGDGGRQARLSSHLCPALPLGVGMMSFLLPTPPVYHSWEPRPQLLYIPSQHWQELVSQSLTLLPLRGTVESLGQWPFVLPWSVAWLERGSGFPMGQPVVPQRVRIESSRRRL